MNKIKIKEILTDLFINKKNYHFLSDSINDKSYTYGEFLEISLIIFKNLKSQKIEPQDVICYICDNSVYTLALYLANLLLGSIIAPIDSLKGDKEIKEAITITNPKIVLNSKNLENIVSEKSETNETSAFCNLNYEAPFLITFTSGSTGEAKGVIHSFENLVKSALEFGEKFSLNEKNIFYHNFPMAYMAGILNLFIKPMIFGSKIVVSRRLSVSTAMNFWQKVIKYEVNSFWFNPTFVSLLMKLDRGAEGIAYAKSKQITACIGTAPLNVNLKKNFEKKYGFELFESYGLSETLFLSTNYPNHSKTGSVGEILSSVDMIFDDDGEIKAKAPWMLLKYLNTAPKLDKDKFPTGDLGFLKEKKLIISGRKKDIIIRGGVNISPKKIEIFINNYFEEFVIIGLKDDILGEKIVCFYVGDETDNFNFKDLNTKIIKELGKDYSIDSFIKLNEIQKNINGKVDRIKLKKEYEECY